MKYDLSKKQTKGAKRTLESFSTAMFTLLTKKSFEKININELCEITSIPRATFYNYFDDKFDLMSYCWYTLAHKIHIEDYKSIAPEQRTYILFNGICDLLLTNKLVIKKILRNNPKNSLLLYHFHSYFYEKANEIFQDSPNINMYNMPYEIISHHYCNTILLIFEWAFFENNNISKDEAYEYLKHLLGLLN